MAENDKTQKVGTKNEIEEDQESSIKNCQNSTKTAHVEFAACLTQVDPRLKFTFETEENGQLPFLDTLLTHQPDGPIATSVYRKSLNTGLTIQPNQDPNAWIL